MPIEHPSGESWDELSLETCWHEANLLWLFVNGIDRALAWDGKSALQIDPEVFEQIKPHLKNRKRLEALKAGFICSRSELLSYIKHRCRKEGRPADDVMVADLEIQTKPFDTNLN